MVGRLSIFNPFGAEDQFAFFLASGEGDQDNKKFKIYGSILKIKEQFSSEQKANIRIRAVGFKGKIIE